MDAVILDIGLPDISGVEVLRWMRERGSKVPVLILTAHATLEHAIASRKLGVADYLIKPLELAKLEETVSAMVSRVSAAPVSKDSSTAPMIGASPCMHPVLLGVAKACAGPIRVLISGPSGSGKSLAARVIHTNRGSSLGTMRTFACGRFETEDQLCEVLSDSSGTVVFEHLSDLNLDLQQVLANLASTSSGQLPAMMATVQQDTQELLASEELREDLYYGFSSMIIAMPALKERSGDIPALARFFTAIENRDGQTISDQAMAALQSYDWPGNIRELRNVLDHACAVSKGQAILPGHLPHHVVADFSEATGSRFSRELEMAIGHWLEGYFENAPPSEWKYDELHSTIEASLIRHLLGKFENRPTHLAAAMGMNRATLRQKIRRLLG